MLIVRDKYYPEVVHNDPYGRYLVLEITFFGEVVWVVGIYAPNQATQRIALWGSLLQTLSVGRPGLLMGDFNMCVDASQSTSEHSIMDDPEQVAWDSLAMEVLKLDVWTWLHGNDPGFTFQSAQHKQTWSRLDRMYVMHDDSFLPTSLRMTVLQDVGISDTFLFVWRFVVMQLTCINPYLESLHYTLTLLFCFNLTLILLWSKFW